MRDIEPRAQKGVLSHIDEVGAKSVSAVADAVGRTARFAVKMGLAILTVGFVGGTVATLYVKSDAPIVSSQALPSQTRATSTEKSRRQVDFVEPNVRVAANTSSGYRPILDWLEGIMGAEIGRHDDIVERKR